MISKAYKTDKGRNQMQQTLRECISEYKGGGFGGGGEKFLNLPKKIVAHVEENGESDLDKIYNALLRRPHLNQFEIPHKH